MFFIDTPLDNLQLKNIVPCEITNIYQFNKKTVKEKSSHKLLISRKTEKVKFLRYIYCPHTVCLSRKYELVCKIFPDIFS